MSALPCLIGCASDLVTREVTKPTNVDGIIVEAWAEGYMVGSLIIMSCITVANMRRGVLLHKLILTELIFGYWQGFYFFFNPPIYAWWLSVAAIPLNISWSLHNVIAWMKIKPFLPRRISMLFITTVILVQPYWVVEIYANFTYFHNINDVFLHTRPWEALCRDPWWVATTVFLFYNIKTKYDLTINQIIRISPRFAIMLGAMILSIIFITLDVLSVTEVIKGTLPVGINPFWKLSFVFKCLTDSVILDDFKTALDRLRAFKISRLGSFAIDNADVRRKEHAGQIMTANNWQEPRHDTAADPPSPDGDYIRMSGHYAPPAGWDTIDVGTRRDLEEGPRAGNSRTQAQGGNISNDLDGEANQPAAHESAPARSDRDAPILAHKDGWAGNSSDSNLQMEYASALRDMAHDTAPRD